MKKWTILSAVLWSVVSISLAGTTRGDEPEYRDRPLSYWVEQLKDRDPFVRANAATSVGWMGPAAKDAVPALDDVLRDLNGAVRYQAAWALGQIGPDARDAVPNLIYLVKAHDTVVRGAAIKSLGLIGPDAKAAVPALMDVLQRRVPAQELLMLRSESAKALGRIGPDAKEAVPMLIQALRDTEGSRERLRENAAVALGKISVASPQVIEALSAALQQDTLYIRLRAAEALGRLGTESAAVALRAAAQDRDSRVQAAARDALKRIESEGSARTQ